jgi:mono/diheme cytochrome c family protein
MKSIVRNLVSAGLLCGTAMLLTPGAWAADAAAGKTVYLAKCKSCHGTDGTPPPAMAKALGIKPINDPATQAKTDAALKDVVTKGEGKMKPVAGIAGADLDNVIAAVRAMK